MKNKIALASAFVAASSLATAEIVINDFLSFEGFIDMSYQHSDLDSDVGGDPGEGVLGDGSDNSFGVDQVEIVWLFDFDPVTAQIDIDYEEANSDDGDEEEVEVEQAFATYSFEDGLAITAGRMASMLGFEAFEPTGLYQFSFAYDYAILPGYAQGVKVTYETEDMFFGGSLLDGYSDSDGSEGRLGGSGDSTFAIELAASFLFGDNDEFAWFVGGYYEDAESDTTGEDGDTYAINTYVTYETGAWIFAGEISYGETEVGAYTDIFDVTGNGTEESISGLLMANYAYSDQASVTGRISFEQFDLDNGNSDEVEQIKLTLAHGYAFTDNLSLVTEISYVDGEYDSDSPSRDGDFDGLLGAIELIFAF